MKIHAESNILLLLAACFRMWKAEFGCAGMADRLVGGSLAPANVSVGVTRACVGFICTYLNCSVVRLAQLKPLGLTLHV